MAHLENSLLVAMQMSTSTTATTAGSQKARDIGLLRATSRGHATYDNTWNVMREYNRSVASTTGPPPLEATWTEMEKSLAPSFQLSKVNTSAESPLSPNPSPLAIKRFNEATNRMVVFERYSTDQTCQNLVAWFARNHLLGDNDYLQTVFLRHAFDERQTKINDLTAMTWNNFFSAWAELEVNDDYNDPVFPMTEGMTNAASPVVSGDWSMDGYSKEKYDWIQAHPPYVHNRGGRGEHGWG